MYHRGKKSNQEPKVFLIVHNNKKIRSVHGNLIKASEFVYKQLIAIPL